MQQQKSAARAAAAADSLVRARVITSRYGDFDKNDVVEVELRELERVSPRLHVRVVGKRCIIENDHGTQIGGSIELREDAERLVDDLGGRDYSALLPIAEEKRRAEMKARVPDDEGVALKADREARKGWKNLEAKSSAAMERHRREQAKRVVELGADAARAPAPRVLETDPDGQEPALVPGQ